MVCGHGVVTLSLTIHESLKRLSSLPILMQESFWWWQCSDRYITSLFPHLHTPFPSFSPSLISLMVSVDVKHHVYLLTLPVKFPGSKTLTCSPANRTFDDPVRNLLSILCVLIETFHELMRKRGKKREKKKMVSNLAFLLIVFRVTARQTWQWKG